MIGIFGLRFSNLEALKSLNKNQLIKDIISGIIVAVIALPLSIAFAIGAGVSAEKGIYSAIISSLICGILGGSRVQISGPTGAFIVITQSVILNYGMEGLAVSMMIAGIILMLMGIFRMGKLIKFIPSPITTGFTAGIGVTIFTLEIKDFLGLEIASMPTKFVDKWHVYLDHLSEINYQAVLLGIVCIIILVLWPRINKTIPNSFVAIIVGTLLSQGLHLDVRLLGEIPKSIGMPHIPEMGIQMIIDLMQPGLTIAILIAMQALLSAVVTDGIISSKTCSNTELFAQGIANGVLGLFGCIPATGGVARGIASAKNGARTPVAAIVHSVMLFVFLILLMPLIKLVPLCVLAAILIVVSYNMFNVKAMFAYRKAPKSDLAVLVCACVLTFAFDLVFAIEVGMVLSCALFMKRMSDVTQVESWKYITDMDYEKDDEPELKDVPKGVLVYEISGPLFFAATDKMIYIQNSIREDTKVIILRMRSVPAIDATALNSLCDMQSMLRKRGITLIFSHVNQQPKMAFDKHGFTQVVGEENFCTNIDQALIRAEQITEGE
ncbi:MAG: SulP family inorganic anion transporter [Thermoflexaceae bacterium]|nr:SulP family inorganic anion transporter [Thermoflexaceae bacterium]